MCSIPEKHENSLFESKQKTASKRINRLNDYTKEALRISVVHLLSEFAVPQMCSISTLARWGSYIAILGSFFVLLRPPIFRLQSSYILLHADESVSAQI